MTTLTRNLTQIDGANVPAPTQNGFSATSLEVFANDAAYEAVYGAGQQGDKYFNSTELLEREHDGTSWVYVNKALTATTDSSTTGADNDLAATRFDLIRFTEGSLTSIRSIDPAQHKILYMVNDQAGTQTITWKNEDGAATAANRIVTGTGDNVIQEVGQTLVMVYDSEASRWRIAGGTGSGGGGLEIEVVTNAESPVTGEIGKWYVTDTSSGEININLPDISAIPSSQQANAAIRVSDCKNNWHVNKVTLTPFSGDSIDGNATDEVMDLDVEGQYVWVARESSTSWCFDTNIQPTETGTTGTGGGGKNYILNPDAASGTSDVVGDSGFTVALTTAAGELAEEIKGTGFKISGSGLTAGTSKVAWTIYATGIDDADGGFFGRCIFRVLDISGSINGETTIQVYNVTQSKYVGESDTITGTGTYYLDVPLVATEVYEAHLIAVGTTVSNIGISGVTIEPVSQTVAGVISKPKAYNATYQGFGSITNERLEYTIIGKSVRVQGEFDPGTLSGVTARIGLPNNWTVDFVHASSTTPNLVGMCRQAQVLADSVFNVIATHGDTFVNLSLDGDGTSTNALSPVLDTTFGGNVISVDFTVPVAELANAHTPTASDVQYESARGRWYRNAALTYTANTAMAFDTEDSSTFDSALGITNASGVFTVDATGTYDITSVLGNNGPWGSGSTVALFVNRGSGMARERIISRAPASSSTAYLSGNGSLKLNAGDSFQIEVNAGGSMIVGDPAFTWIEIERRSDYSARKASLPFPNATIKVDQGGAGAAGHGTINTKIRRFVNTTESVGSAITYADSADDGASFTINEDGIYAIEWNDEDASAVAQIGISVNSSQLTTNVASITKADRLAYTATPAAGVSTCLSITRILNKGDIIRPHDGGALDSTSAVTSWFQITQVYKLGN